MIVFVPKKSQADRRREAVVLPARGRDELKTFGCVQKVRTTVALRILLEESHSICRKDKVSVDLQVFHKATDWADRDEGALLAYELSDRVNC